jgi:creatinine amidohydrolase
MMFSGILEEMTVDDVRTLAPEVVVLPIGSTEPHGPHLPYGTDFFTADGICRRAVPLANQKGGRVLMYPGLPIGNNVNFKAFPFACRIGVQTLIHVVNDILAAIEEEGIRKIVIVNVHGGNTDTLHAALREHHDRQPHDPARRRSFVCMVGATEFASSKALACIEHPSSHAGEKETVLMMALKPDLVRPDRFDDFPVRVPIVPSLAAGKGHHVRPWHELMPMSAGGETRKSNREKGERIVESSVAGLAAFLVELSNSPWSPSFPFAPRESA